MARMPIFSRGQMSVEFFFLFAMILVLFGLFFMFMNELEGYANYATDAGKSASVAFTIAHSINTVFLGADGLTANVDIPVGYTITVQPHSIIASDNQNRTGSSSVLATNISLSIPLNSSHVVVRNLNGSISVTG